MTDVRDIPVYINCRDRVADLPGMIQWLEDAGQRQIILIDNASTYPPLLEFYDQTSHQVVRLAHNIGHLSLFWGAVPMPEAPFFYSDPDLVFLGPHSGLQRLYDVAQTYPERDKVGFGLSLDGVPDTMPSLSWERELWNPSRQVEPDVFDAPLDTTFAVYNRPSQDIWNSLRIGGEHVVKHTSWYADPDNLDEENQYYVDNMIGTLYRSLKRG